MISLPFWKITWYIFNALTSRFTSGSAEWEFWISWITNIYFGVFSTLHFDKTSAEFPVRYFLQFVVLLLFFSLILTCSLSPMWDEGIYIFFIRQSKSTKNWLGFGTDGIPSFYYTLATTLHFFSSYTWVRMEQVESRVEAVKIKYHTGL